MRDLHRLRSEAEILAAELPDFQALTKERVTAQPGGAPRQRAGHGEDFWQYRSQSPEDSASAIDWRRSATGDDFYIREHELQSARLLEIGMDGSEGFDWSGDAKRFSKADEARVILTSIALRFAEDGDLVSVLGSGKAPVRSGQLSARLLEDLDHGENDGRPAILRREAGFVIFASDFYGDLETLQNWVNQSAGEGSFGILLQVVDPLEAEFPFSGRVKFSRPGGLKERIFGRTEGLKDEYFARFMQRQDAVRDIARRVGWQFEAHIVGQPRRPLAFRIIQALADRGDGK
tara:strand:+ start:14517 stop:15386 length:870 start_codon:yes stop_codon:yes gene_type:complete